MTVRFALVKRLADPVHSSLRPGQLIADLAAENGSNRDTNGHHWRSSTGKFSTKVSPRSAENHRGPAQRLIRTANKVATTPGFPLRVGSIPIGLHGRGMASMLGGGQLRGMVREASAFVG
jgi:hypothetical protein